MAKTLKAYLKKYKSKGAKRKAGIRWRKYTRYKKLRKKFGGFQATKKAGRIPKIWDILPPRLK